ncbi:MAG: hypothetical protein RIF41_07140 [Polyangiaceae bacterium]
MSSSPFRNRSFASRSAVAASRFAQLMVVSAALVTGGLAMGGCPGSLENPERFTGGGGPGGAGACPDIETELFPQRCTDGTNCHTADFEAAGLDLESPGIGERIVNAPAVGADCMGMPMADPNDPTGSIIYNVLTDDSCSPFGQMPFGGDPLSQAEIDCVEEWITTLEGGNPTTPSSGMGGGGMGGMGGAGGMGMGGAGGM